MKKAFLILLAALICLTGTACRKKEPSETTKAKTTSAEPVPERTGSTADSTTGAGITTTFPSLADPTPQPDADDTLLYSKNGISLYFRALANGTGTKDIRFFVQNAGDQAVTVRLNLMAVNRYAVPTSEFVDLIPQTAASITLSVWNSNLASIGILELSDISEIAVQISVRDGSYDTILDQTVTYTIPKDG